MLYEPKEEAYIATQWVPQDGLSVAQQAEVEKVEEGGRRWAYTNS